MGDNMLKGSIVALVTPFDDNNQVNYSEIKQLLEFHIENKTDGILLLGTTAESESLKDEEKKQLVEYVLHYLNGRIKVMVGLIANLPQRVVELATLFDSLDIDSYLVSPPYYIKSNTTGIIKYFSFIADHVGHPIVLYNVPKRTGVEITEEVVQFLSYHPNIIGIKEASGNLVYQTKVALICNENFVLYGADDLSMMASLGLGAVGIISVINNAFPKEVKLIIDSFEKDKRISMLTYKKISKLTEDIYKETSPIPIKYLLYVMGYKTRNLRMPLAEASIGLRRKIEEDYLAFIDED